MLTIAAGGEHSLAILGDFSVMAWGANNLGQLGSNSPTDQRTPVAVPGIKAIEVAASSFHSLALTTDANVMGWGGNDACQLGIDPPPDGEPITQITCSDHPQPTLVFGRSAPPRPSTTGGAIAATNSLTLIVLSNGSVYGMGGQDDPAQGQFRGICNTDVVLGPAELYSLPGTIKEVAAGENHALFLTDTGEVWALGANLTGQGGTGTTSVQECPHAIPATSVRGASMLAAGKEHSLALIRGTLSASQSLIDFGNQPYGTGSPASRDVTLNNSGLVPVTLYSFGVLGTGDYSLTEDCPDQPATLAPNGNCRITVSFAPAAPGQRDGRITVTHDGQGQPVEVALTGRGTEAKVTFTPSTVNFGTQAAGTSGPAQTVTIQNTGEAPLLINNVEATAGFTLSNDTCDKNPVPIQAQNTCTVQVAFSPSVTGAAVGELRVDYEPNNQLAILSLEGTGN